MCRLVSIELKRNLYLRVLSSRKMALSQDHQPISFSPFLCLLFSFRFVRIHSIRKFGFLRNLKNRFIASHLFFKIHLYESLLAMTALYSVQCTLLKTNWKENKKLWNFKFHLVSYKNDVRAFIQFQSIKSSCLCISPILHFENWIISNRKCSVLFPN